MILENKGHVIAVFALAKTIAVLCLRGGNYLAEPDHLSKVLISTGLYYKDILFDHFKKIVTKVLFC